MTPFALRALDGVPALAPGEIHVWSARLDPPDRRVEELGRSLASDEWQRANRFHFEVHRRRFVVGRGVLRHLLGAYLGLPPQSLAFTYAERGKPDLAPGLERAPSGHRLFFNVSHSEDLALFGLVLGREIGVDVEYMKEMDDLHRIAERFFSATENAALTGLPESRQQGGILQLLDAQGGLPQGRGGGARGAARLLRRDARPG